MGRGREVRLGLVLNGGVSLAVWIGGVTREIDAARRGSSGAVDRGATSELYGRILDAIDDDLIVDVVAGASAGGINGVLLGAAIVNGTKLSGLEDTWLSIGDFRRLLRSPAVSDPPSLMKGDELILPGLREALGSLWRHPAEAKRPDHPLYLYVTATDLFGYPADFIDSIGDSFEEVDHRRVFSFEFEKDERDPLRDPLEKSSWEPGLSGVMRPIVRLLDPDAAELLAQAARSSSSFPVAFESHQLSIADEGELAGNGQGLAFRVHAMVDGGILDNQPFNPVLDRVAVLPSVARPVRRSIAYVVPYATDVGATRFGQDPAAVSARDTFSAAGSLPRDLPKLQSLERVTRECLRVGAADLERNALLDEFTPGDLSAASGALLGGYKCARFISTQSTFEAWARPNFRPGSGEIAQRSGDDPEEYLRPIEAELDLRDVPWIPTSRQWHSDEPGWTWGLSPAERTATWALQVLRDAAWKSEREGKGRARDLYLGGRLRASDLIWQARKAKVEFRRAFVARSGSRDVVERAEAAWNASEDLGLQLRLIQQGFRSLAADLEEAGGWGIQCLLDLEVARNGVGVVGGAPPAPFRFIFASARVQNSLGHEASDPDAKLAGMKLNHFGGFLKRSWRANDWLWGRMDGVEHLLRILIDEKVVRDLRDGMALELAQVAFPTEDEADRDEIEALAACWKETLSRAVSVGGADVKVESVVQDRAANEADQLAGLLSRRDGTGQAVAAFACRRALAARLQLRVLRADLRRIAETAVDDLEGGSSRLAAGASWMRRYPLVEEELPAGRLISLFQAMDVGAETLIDESSSRLGLDVGAQTSAVAAAVFAGNRGGLPATARGALGSIRGGTLIVSRLVRLLAREPWIGAAVVTLLSAATVWAALSQNTLLGAFLPALALLVAAGGLSLLTIGTSIFEESPTTLARAAGFAVFAGAPLAFFVLALWPWRRSGVGHWLSVHVGSAPTSAAAVAAAIAAGAAIARLLSNRRGWIRGTLFSYRAAIVTGLGILVIGFVVERALLRHGGPGHWVAAADERRGTILIIVLVAVLVTAALVEEFAAWARIKGRRLRLRQQRREFARRTAQTAALSTTPAESSPAPESGASLGTP